MYFSKIVTPRFGDLDGLRHINNCRIAEWFELGREPLFRFFNPDMCLETWNLIMARIAIDYVGQMRLGLDVELRTWVKRIGRSSFTAYQEAWQNGIVCAKGESVIVYFDFELEKSIEIPEDLRQKLQACLISEDNTF